jgi:hypothetical protein
VTNQDVIDAVLAWARDTIPAVAGGYDFVPPGKPEALPDVVVDLESEGFDVGPTPEFPWPQLQQRDLYVWRLVMSFMVGAGKDQATHQAAAHQLRVFAEALRAALAGDPTLGKRVFLASPLSFRIDYTPPFVEWSDGTRGREMTVNLAVAQLQEVVS